MTQIDEQLPRLQHPVALVQVVNAVALLRQAYRGLVHARVREHQVLAQGAPQRDVRGLLQGVAIDQVLLDALPVLIGALLTISEGEV